jgi:hypothetical protein
MIRITELYQLRYKLSSSVSHPQNPMGAKRAVEEMKGLVLDYPSQRLSRDIPGMKTT